MLLLAPLRLLRLAFLPPRIVGHALFRHRLVSLKLALVILAVAGMIAFFGRRRSGGTRA